MRAALASLIYLIAAPVAAQSVVVSPAAETVSLTVYRAPWRGEQPINVRWPQGYALITETRTITIPAGESVVRFEGVSDGLFPETAIVTGLPKGVREKNRDARLLSPAGLVDAYLKRQVKLTRTDRATGATREEIALVTAGPDDGVILQTDAGYEALRCTGLPERMRYDNAPKDLSAKPTLSVVTSSEKDVTATVTLSYMAGGFDWQANYVLNAGKFSDDHKIDVDVFAWLTIANGGTQGFANAQLMAIAGNPNRQGNARLPQARLPALVIRCWPQQRTHEVPFRLPYDANANIRYDIADAMEMRMEAMPMLAMAAPPPPPPAPKAAMVAQQEDLGDLKLYRVPERVDVNAQGQKQVAMIVKPETKFRRIYRAEPIWSSGHQPDLWMTPTLIGSNDKDKGLGLPLPSGSGMVFENGGRGNQLIGEVKLSDRTIGDKVELALPATMAVRVVSNVTARTKDRASYQIEIANSNPFGISAEILLPATIRKLPRDVRKRDGRPVWFVAVPANDRRSISVTVPQQ